MSAPSTDADDPGGSLTGTLQALLHELPGLVSDRVELFALELGRAASALARLLAWVVAMAILGVTAWLALWSAVVIALVQAGWHWALALAAVMVANLAAVAFAATRVRGLAGRVSLPATRRHLTLARRADTDGEPTPTSANAPPPHAAAFHDAQRPLH